MSRTTEKAREQEADKPNTEESLKAEEPVRAPEVQKQDAQAEKPRIVRMEEHTQWLKFLEKEHKLPQVRADEAPPEHKNPNVLPDAIKALEARIEIKGGKGNNAETKVSGGPYKFCLIQEPHSDHDWAQMQEFTRQGYVPATRSNMGDQIPDEMYDARGVVVVNGQVLFVTPVEMYLRRRLADMAKSDAALGRSRDGVDEQGKQIPYVQTDPGVLASISSNRFDIPGDIGHNAPLTESEGII